MSISPLFQSAVNLSPLVIHDTYGTNNTITLYHGDSQTFLKSIPDGAISLVVTSPPSWFTMSVPK